MTGKIIRWRNYNERDRGALQKNETEASVTGIPLLGIDQSCHFTLEVTPPDPDYDFIANNMKEKQYVTRLMTNPTCRGTTKGEAADAHQTRISQMSQKNEYIITYTNGSMKEVEQENWTGAGWVIYWKGIERRSGNKGMGRFIEVYDAEMLAPLRGLEAAVDFQQELPEVDRRRLTVILVWWTCNFMRSGVEMSVVVGMKCAIFVS